MDAAEALASADQLVHAQKAADEVDQSHRKRRRTIASQGATKRLESLNRLKHAFYQHMTELTATGKPICSRQAEPFYRQWLLHHPGDAPDIDPDNITRTLCEGWGKHKKGTGH